MIRAETNQPKRERISWEDKISDYPCNHAIE